jgi:hypothetical protein
LFLFSEACRKREGIVSAGLVSLANGGSIYVLSDVCFRDMIRGRTSTM